MDKFDPSVQKFVTHLRDIVELKRSALERKGKCALDTEFIRGEIKTLKFVINTLTGDHEDNDPTS